MGACTCEREPCARSVSPHQVGRRRHWTMIRVCQGLGLMCIVALGLGCQRKLSKESARALLNQKWNGSVTCRWTKYMVPDPSGRPGEFRLTAPERSVQGCI